MTVRVSINLTDQTWAQAPAGFRAALARVADAADEAGLDTLWVPDHLLQADPSLPPGDADMLEAYTTLGFLAARTERVRLGTMVTGVTFRPPAVLVKAVTSLDVLSGGRAWLGIGAGYHADEADRMGLEMPSTAERFERLEETVRLALQMWHGDESAFASAHYTLTGPSGIPLPISRPHPPILIGGHGERKTLRLVARYASACNLFDIPDGGATVRHKLDVLRRHCDDVGRPYEEIDKTLSSRLRPDESSEELIRRAEEHATLGIEHLVLITPQAWTPERLGVVAEAVPRLRELAVGG